MIEIAPGFRLDHRSARPLDETADALRFVIERLPKLSALCAIRTQDSAAERGWRGWASDARVHDRRKWAGRARFAISLWLPHDESPYLGAPLVTGHARVRDGFRAVWDKRERTWVERPAYRPYVLDEIVEAWERGDRFLGRWPITVCETWQDATVDIAAHELRHVAQYDRDSGPKASEVECEIFAAAVIAEWRQNLRERRAA